MVRGAICAPKEGSKGGLLVACWCRIWQGMQASGGGSAGAHRTCDPRPRRVATSAAHTV